MPKEYEDVETKSSDSPEVYKQTRFMECFEKAFPWLLCVGAALGLILMVVIPNAVFQEKSDVQLKAQSDLRLAILYTTGGMIAALGLLETYRKNTNDRTKANADINAALKNQKHQTKVLKEQIRQFDENAFKERKAERRERYTKAVEQLGDEKAPIRMGGVYTLVGLVDEWLEEENLSESERVKEGQVIINNLCAYIRSPFTLASHYDELSQNTLLSEAIYKDKEQEFYTDKATLDSEADVRFSIMKEIHDRLHGSEENTPGKWSDFEYDFSGSTFFYPIDLRNSYYAKPINFSGSTYQVWAYFSGSTYQGRANFSDSTYQGRANFGSSTYEGEADFSGSTYKKDVTFSMFSDTAMIIRSTYKGKVDFSGSIYQGRACFAGSTYKGGAYFYNSIYQGEVYFRSSTYKGGAYYEGVAYFHNSIYQGEVYFDNDTTHKGVAYFDNSIYQGEVYFRGSTYEGGADFSGSIFYSEIYFNYSKYSIPYSRFVDYAPQFYDKKKRKNTLFGSPNNDFTVDIDKGYPIDLNSEGIPLSCKQLAPEQKEYLADKFQEIDETNNKLLEAKDDEEKARLSDMLRSLYKELRKWREEVTTVKVGDSAIESTES